MNIQKISVLLGFTIFGLLALVLYWMDKEVTQGAVTEYLKFAQSFLR